MRLQQGFAAGEMGYQLNCAAKFLCRHAAGLSAVCRTLTNDWSPISKRQRLPLSVNCRPRLQHLTWNPWSVARCDPSERVTNTGVVRGHRLRPEQALQFARVVADRLHIIGCDLQQPAQILVEYADN